MQPRLSAVDARPAVAKDMGIWRAGTIYGPGHLVTHGGKGWICTDYHRSDATGFNHAGFRLFDKSTDAR
jgi:hypothetical protein